jgi:hypothetical protein
MSTLDEITKEKQRLGAALARVDAQREKLTGQLGELETTERVIAAAAFSKRTARGRESRPVRHSAASPAANNVSQVTISRLTP